MEDTSIRSRRGKAPPCRNTPILLSAIKYNSTNDSIPSKILAKSGKQSDKRQNVEDVNSIGAQNMLWAPSLQKVMQLCIVK